MKIHPPSSSRGFISIGCLPYLIAIVLLVMGVQAIYTVLKNREPLSISVSEYIAKKPSVEWVSFTNASLNLLESAHLTKYNAITEVFIPVREGGEPLGSPVQILLSTKKPEVIAALGDLKASTSSSEAAGAAMKRQAAQILVKRDVSGLIRFGMDEDSKTRSKLEGLDMNLAKDFVILNDGEKPDLLKGVLMLAGGLVLGLYLLRRAGSQPAGPPPVPVPNLPPKM